MQVYVSAFFPPASILIHTVNHTSPVNVEKNKNKKLISKGYHVQVCATSELHVEVWDIGGVRRLDSMQNRDVDSVADVLKQSRFLGRVSIPLLETLSRASPIDHPSHTISQTVTKRWFTLARAAGTDMVSGSIALSFSWTVLFLHH